MDIEGVILGDMGKERGHLGLLTSNPEGCPGKGGHRRGVYGGRRPPSLLQGLAIGAERRQSLVFDICHSKK